MFDFLPADRERVAFRHALSVGCEAVRERDFKLLGIQVFDLSMTGMLIESLREDVSVGEEVVVTFRPPRTDRWVDAEAIVSRVITGRRRGDSGPAVGLLFTNIERASFVTLKTALRKLPPARPRRPSRMDYASLARVISTL